MNEVLDTLSSVWSVDPASIPHDASINAYGPWDSLGHITLLLALSERFGFALTPENVQDLTTLPAIVSFVSGEVTDG